MIRIAEMTKISRKRPISSCKYCYKHKVKCDRGNPCGNCIRLNNSSCEYNFQSFLHHDLKNQKSTEKRNSSIVTYPSNALFPHLGSMMRKFIMNSISNKTASCIGFFDFSKEADSEYFRVHIHELLPEKKTLTKCFSMYWNCIHPLLPILDESAICKKFESFLKENNLAEKEEVYEPQFLIVIFAVLFSTTIQLELIISDSEKRKELQCQKDKCYVGFKRLLALLNFPNVPSFECVSSSLIVYEVGTFCYRQIAFEICVLCKTLCSMGIHLANNNNKATMQGITLRKQVMWHTAHKIETMSTIWCGSLPNANLHVDIVGFPNASGSGAQSSLSVKTVNPFIASQNLIYKVLPYFSDLTIFLNVDTESDYYRSFDFTIFERKLFSLCQHFRDVQDEIVRCDTTKFEKKTNRWLIANSRNMLYRLYFLYYVCLEDKTTRSRSSSVLQNSKEIENIKNKLYKADENLYTNFLKMRKPYDGKLVEIVMLLLYESRIRLSFEDEIVNFKWSIKNCNPFQYLVILVKDIYNQPHKRYTFEDLNESVQLLVEEKIFSADGDLRVWLVSEVLKRLDSFKKFWPESSYVIYDFLVNLWNFVESPRQTLSDETFELLLNSSSLKEANGSPLSSIIDYLPFEFANNSVEEYYHYFDFPTDF